MFSKKLVFSLIISCFILSYNFKAYAATWYISPTGDDTKTGAGTSINTPFKKFSTAWDNIKRGDTLILMDGTYTPSNSGVMNVTLPPDNGQRIYIKAQNIGKAVIDAQFLVKSPVDISKFRGGANLEIDGIVAKNGSSDANLTSAVFYFEVTNANILLKNVSGFNADKDSNSSVFSFYQSSGVTIEDCIAGGSGRKMIMLYRSSNNTIRRCVARWLQFDGAKFCGSLSWPAGSGIEVYFGDNNILENNIGFGNVAYYHFALKGYKEVDGNQANNNKFLGNMSLFAGKYADGTKVNYGTKPANTMCSDSDMNKQDMVTAYQTVAESWTVSYMANNLFQDNLAYKSGGLALTSSGNWYGAGWSNNSINRATFVGNNSFRTNAFDMDSTDSSKYSITNSTMKLSNGTSLNSGKAQLQNRYINGTLTSQPLWPWPMEDQVREQFKTHLSPTWGGTNPDLYNFSVTQRVCVNVLKGDSSVAAVSSNFDCWAGGASPTPIASPSVTPSATPRATPTTLPSPTKTPTPQVTPTVNLTFDVNSDGKVNLLDVIAILNEIFK